MFKFIFKYINKNKLLATSYFVSVIFVQLSYLILPILESNFINLLIEMSAFVCILRVMAIFLSIQVFGLLLNCFASYTKNKLEANVNIDMEMEITSHLHKVKKVHLSALEPAYLSQRISSDTSKITEFFINNYVYTVVNAIVLLSAFIVLYKSNYKIIMPFVFLVPLYIVIYLLFKKPLYNTHLEELESQNSFHSELYYQYRYIEKIKIEADFVSPLRILKNSFNKYFIKMMRHIKLALSFEFLEMFLSDIFLVFMLVYSGYLIIHKEMSVGDIVLVTSYFSAVIEKIQYYLSFGADYQDCKGSYNRMMELYTLPQEYNGAICKNHIRYIKLNNLHFSYSNNVEIINDINFVFEQGKTYFICGENGSGKSTLMQILLGIEQDATGTVLFDKTNLFDLDMYKLRKEMVSVVMQEPTCKNCTVEEYLGIEYKNRLINDAYINMFLDKDYFHIKKILYQNTDSLSGGEMQKVEIVKSLLKNPSLWVLDEPSSSLDFESTDILKNLFLNLKQSRIIIVITHDSRLQGIEDCILGLQLHNEIDNRGS